MCNILFPYHIMKHIFSLSVDGPGAAGPHVLWLGSLPLDTYEIVLPLGRIANLFTFHFFRNADMSLFLDICVEF